MAWNNHHSHLFGQLLVRSGLVTEEQLERAIAHQRSTGQRLGDILAEWDVITHQHVHDMLRRQRRLRLAAAFVGALLGPLEAYAVEAALPPAVAATAVAPPTMRRMDESEMETVSGQGLQEELLLHVQQQMKDRGVHVIGDMGKLVNPVLGFLESDLSMRDVTFDPARAATKLNADGSLTLSLPSTIGELSLNNIRVRGADPAGPSFGSVTMRGIDLTGTTITLALRP
jgi:hypothetical protein